MDRRHEASQGPAVAMKPAKHWPPNGEVWPKISTKVREAVFSTDISQTCSVNQLFPHF